MKFARLLLRVIVGALFVGHGAQKLFGWFGGHGLDATAKGFESLGARPGRVNAIAASSTEIGGGTLLALGLATPLAAAGLISVMLTAINRVHGKKGIWNTDGGYEYNLVLIATLMALTEAGPGPLSFDGDRLSGPGWALAALLGGIGAAAGAHAYSAAQPEPQPAAPTAAQSAPEPEPVGASA
jgi:putative oxidoreductase